MAFIHEDDVSGQEETLEITQVHSDNNQEERVDEPEQPEPSLEVEQENIASYEEPRPYISDEAQTFIDDEESRDFQETPAYLNEESNDYQEPQTYINEDPTDYQEPQTYTGITEGPSNYQDISEVPNNYQDIDEASNNYEEPQTFINEEPSAYQEPRTVYEEPPHQNVRTVGDEEETIEDEREEQTVAESSAPTTSRGDSALVPSHNTLVSMADCIRARVTLKPRRTLSLSPTPARTYNMMSHNLSAAVLLDCIDKDADDGLGVFYQNSLQSEEKTKSLVLGRSGSLPLSALTGRGRPGHSMKRPLEVTLPCQEIQYLDISYQKVQFSPIPRKKIAYHPVPYHNIHYSECCSGCHCNVPKHSESPTLLLAGSSAGRSLLDCGKRFC